MTAVRALQRKVHLACRQLGIDAETRRDLQQIATGKASMSDMTEAELRRLIGALEKRGFKAGSTGRHKPAPRPDLRYIHVLWSLLGKAGALKKPGRAGLNAFVRSRFEGKWQSVPIDIDTLREAGQINDVIRALKDMCARAGIRTEL